MESKIPAITVTTSMNGQAIASAAKTIQAVPASATPAIVAQSENHSQGEDAEEEDDEDEYEDCDEL
jgi:ribosomal protein L12E/L44/L45/RPP1/RPP2